MATPVGLEPTTPGLEVQCSDPTELRGRRASILANSWRLTAIAILTNPLHEGVCGEPSGLYFILKR
jgi:hypothetical protein